MKKVIDILGIVLPALIIILGIVRIFVKKTKGVNGLIMLFAILLLIAGLIRYYAFPDKNIIASGEGIIKLEKSFSNLQALKTEQQIHNFIQRLT